MAKSQKQIKPSKTSPLKGIGHFIKSKKFKRLIGLTFILSSIYLLVAFTSFLFTWQYDQDKVLGYGFFELFLNADLKVENWLGKLGAEISHWFLHNGFGVSSYVFVLLSFLVGFKILFRFSLIPFRPALKYSLFVLIWLSIFFGFFFREDFIFLGGGVGYHINTFFISSFGKVGAGVLIFFSLLGFLAINFNFEIAFIKNWLEPKNTDNISDESDNTTISDPQQETTETESEKLQNDEEEHPNETEFSSTDFTFEEEESIIEEKIKKEEPVDLESQSSDFEIEIPQEEAIEDFDQLGSSKENTLDKGDDDDDDLDLDIGKIVEDDSLSKKEVNKLVNDFGEYDPTLELSKFKMPPIDMLELHGEDKIVINREELEENKNKIVDTLKNYNIEISKIKATIGPTVTLYEIVPAPGVRISKIKNLEDDIALSLSALGIRIIAPIPGKGTIGIEVPNQKAEVVSMRTVIASEKFQKTDMALPLALGKGITNETFVMDLAKAPHILMAGATGQGKSVGLNAILVSLLYKKHPSQIKFVLVDPKKVELTLFNKIERHYLAKLPNEEEAIITDTSKVVDTLNSLCIEMDERYDLLKNALARNLKEYNHKFVNRKLNPENGHRYLPYIVVVVDEFADLIMTAGKEVETPIARLAQLARAIGIHLIIATQRPSVNIITGIIKANFPTRIAFRVTSRIDSKTILDGSGADQLIGRGDMLISTGNEMIRLQCAFVDTPEVEAICEYIGNQQGYPHTYELPEFVGDPGETAPGNIADMERDALFDDAARVVVINQQGSASLLQRRLKLGYNRAGRIVDQLEAAGIIGPFEGSKARQVLIPDEISLEHLLNNMND